MKLDEYQHFAEKHAYHGGDLVYNVLGLCGEAGEVVEALDGPAGPMKEEAGDVLFYASRVASCLGLQLSCVMECETFGDFKDCWEHYERIAIYTGLVADEVKKFIRDDRSNLTVEREENLRCALRYVLFCLSGIAYDTGTTLNKIAKKNLKKAEQRNGARLSRQT